MKKVNIWGTFFAAAAAAVLFAGPAYGKEKTLPDGFFVGEISLGGMTEEQARQAVAAEAERLSERKITLGRCVLVRHTSS